MGITTFAQNHILTDTQSFIPYKMIWGNDQAGLPLNVVLWLFPKPHQL